MPTLQQTILSNLLARRKKLQDEYDAMISEPDAYNVTGSVSVTNRKLADLRAELDAIDSQIATVQGTDVFHRRYPNYHDC